MCVYGDGGMGKRWKGCWEGYRLAHLEIRKAVAILLHYYIHVFCDKCVVSLSVSVSLSLSPCISLSLCLSLSLSLICVCVSVCVSLWCQQM